MSKFYNPQRKRNIFNPASEKPYKLSRSKIDLFMNCPRCFYLDRRLGIGQPSGPPFSLNKAVDQLLKAEFDNYRAQQKPHPLMLTNSIDLVPFEHDLLDTWRDGFTKGIQYHHPTTNLIITGGVDDVWVGDDGELSIVDYKATSKNEEINLDAEWQIVYKRQMEVYQWLFRKNGYRVSKTGYFVYCNADSTKKSFDYKLEFVIKIIPYDGDDSWVEEAISNAHQCLLLDTLPEASPACDFCAYRNAARKWE